MSTTMWPSSATAPDPAAVQAPAEYEPAADAGPDREHRDVRGAARRARARLGPDGAVGVVVHLDRQPQPLGHEVGEVQVDERQVDRLDRDPGPP